MKMLNVAALTLLAVAAGPMCLGSLGAVSPAEARATIQDSGPGSGASARPVDDADVRVFAEREASSQGLADFEAGQEDGDVIYVSGGTILLALLIILLIL